MPWPPVSRRPIPPSPALGPIASVPKPRAAPPGLGPLVTFAAPATGPAGAAVARKSKASKRVRGTLPTPLSSPSGLPCSTRLSPVGPRTRADATLPRAIVSLPDGRSPTAAPGRATSRDIPPGVPLPAARRRVICWPTSSVLVCPPGMGAVPPAPERVEFSAILAAAGRFNPISDWVRGSRAAWLALGPEPPSSVCDAIARRAGADGRGRPSLRLDPGAPDRTSAGSAVESPSIAGRAFPRPSIAPRREGNSADPTP